MKKSMILLLILAVTLVACSAAAGNQNGPTSSRSLNAMSALAIGTLKLDGTVNAITKQQASELLPLWQVYKQLSSSSNAAQAEIDALSTQIGETMTSDQHKAISDMKLTQADIFSFMQPAGAAASGTSGQSSRNSTGQGPAGGFPGGDPGGMPPPDMGGGMPGGTTRQGTSTQTANSGPGARPANLDRVPSGLIDAVIQYLQKVAASQP